VYVWGKGGVPPQAKVRPCLHPTDLLQDLGAGTWVGFGCGTSVTASPCPDRITRENGIGPQYCASSHGVCCILRIGFIVAPAPPPPLPRPFDLAQTVHDDSSGYDQPLQLHRRLLERVF